MSLPALRVIRSRFPAARITLLARPWVTELYSREQIVDEILPFRAGSVYRTVRFAHSLRTRAFDCAILLQNAFDAAAIAWLAGIPERIGYARDGRTPLLTLPVPVPRNGDIPRHEQYYYLELLRRAGLLDALPAPAPLLLEGASAAEHSGRALLAEAGLCGAVIGVSPGAAYGTAKRWFPERFASAAADLARARNASVALFGSVAERDLCEAVRVMTARSGIESRNFAGQTSLARFIDMAAACEAFLTNDSGAMHIASALGVPTVAVFGATDDGRTGPAGPRARVVRRPVKCSPCLLRECPVDHRCMAAVSAGEVARAALDLLK
jgi:heptosyltransferase-2